MHLPTPTSYYFCHKHKPMQLSKTRLLLLSLFSGLLLTLAWPVGGFPGLLFVALVPLLFVEEYYMLNKQQYGRWGIFRWAYLSFFVWNALTTWWIWNSTAFGAIMAVIFNSLFTALAFTVYHISRRTLRNGKHFRWLLVVYWIAWEYFHLNWDLSWSWLNLGNGFASYIKWVQWYEYTGTLGGTAWVLIANILIFDVLKDVIQKTARIRWGIAGLIVVWIGLPLWFSLHTYHNYREAGPTADVVVVQPNIDPWAEQYTLPVSEVFRRNIGQAEPLLDSTVNFLVCPESALQETIWLNNYRSSASLQMIDNFLKNHPGITIVIGASTFRYYEPGEPLSPTVRRFADGKGYYDAYNTAFVVDTTPDAGYYHKSKLVPGPEKMPFPQLLRPFQEIAFDLGGTTGSLGLSPERTAFRHAGTGTPFGVAICYESVYGDFMNGFVKNGASLLFVVTNDGWWGKTAGHRQHLSFSSLRAVETRRSIARSANTGISCFINQRGDILQPLPYWTAGAIRGKPVLNEELTFYVRQGDYIGRIAGLTALLFLLVTLTTGLINRKRKLRA